MTTLAECKTKKAQVAFIKQKLREDDRWLLRGLVAIYNKQTAEEQRILTTSSHNNVGFTMVDGYVLSEMAKLIIRRGALRIIKNPATPVQATTFLSPKQLAMVKAKMPKYAKQLLMIASTK